MIDEQLRAVAAANQDFGHPAGFIERFRFIVWLVWGLCAALVAATAWFVRIEYTKVETDKQLTYLQGRVETNRIAIEGNWKADDQYIAANKLLFQQIFSGISANSKELDRREKIQNDNWARLSELWFMKEHGISNADDFFARHGYIPSSLPRFEAASPTPKNGR